MRTEDDLRAALATLERHAPDSLAVLAAVRTRGAARPVINHRRRNRSLIAAAAASVAAVTVASALSAGTFGREGASGPGASTSKAAAVLRQLAVTAAAAPTPALGPVIYAKRAIWGYGPGPQKPDFNQEWTSAAADFFIAGAGKAPAAYTKLDPRHNPEWNWLNPATLPAGLAALRRHLLGGPEDKFVARPVKPDLLVFVRAVRFMATEPLRPAVRASMLRLVASIAQRSPHDFVVLGTRTDRAGHRDTAIAVRAKWGKAHPLSTAVIIYLFDQVTGTLRADTNAYCAGSLSTIAAGHARCTTAGYEQYVVVKAVRSLPKGAAATKTSAIAPYVMFPLEPVVR